jgi:hypothetical protein
LYLGNGWKLVPLCQSDNLIALTEEERCAKRNKRVSVLLG